MASPNSPARKFCSHGCRPFIALLVGVAASLASATVEVSLDAEGGLSNKRAGLSAAALMRKAHAAMSTLEADGSFSSDNTLRQKRLVRKEARDAKSRSKELQPTYGEPDDDVWKPDEHCVDTARSFNKDAADPYSTGQALCRSTGDACNEETNPLAKFRCCDCNGGARYKVYYNTNCMGDSDLPESGLYQATWHDGVEVKNPMEFTNVEECMEVCHGMDSECDAITVINEGSDFAGWCYFRKGTLNYVHRYNDCFNSSCLQFADEVSPDEKMRIEADAELAKIPPEARIGQNNSLPICGSSEHAQQGIKTAEDYPCVVLPGGVPVTHDTVVDTRDCFVKFSKQ